MFRGLKSLIAGVLAGTAIGVLFAPKKGGDMRQKIKDELDEGGTGLSEIKDTIFTMGGEIGSECKDLWNEIMEEEDVQNGKKTVEEYAKKAKKRAKKFVKEKVPAKTRRKAKKALKKAEKKLDEIVKKVKTKK